MNSPQNTPLFIALYRLWQLLWWLAYTGIKVWRFGRLQQAQRDETLMRIAQGLLNILHIRLTVDPQSQQPIKPPILAVANHVSWLDIFVLMSLYPSGFIAKQSIRHWPIIGKIAAHIGTVFINRDSRTDASNVNQVMVAALSNSQSVTFFPEARTSDGLAVLPFKAALFQAAIDAKAPVQAIALRYLDHQGGRTTAVSWAGDMSFFSSLWQIARCPHIVVQVDFATQIDCKSTEHLDRYLLKDAAEQFICHKVNCNEHT